MSEQRKQFIELLQSDSQLLRMLAKNKPFWNDRIGESKKYSIVPVTKISTELKRPFLSVQVLNDNLVETKLSDVFIYVRCYNDGDKTFVDIDKILSRVRVILHNHRFEAYTDGTISIDTVYEATGSDSVDEAYHLNYRESRYRILYL